jgi:p-cumate 2,3-dioxygenase beta subunit
VNANIETRSIYMKETETQARLRREVELFLYADAALLDSWRLEEWTNTLCEDVRYLVPSTDSPDSDYREALFFVSDDYLTLKSRVSQLMGRTAWVENPLSRTRRLIANVLVTDVVGDAIFVAANFAIWRFHQGSSDVYVGRYEHILVRASDGGLRFKCRKAILDMETLRPHGRLSIIL